VQEGSAEGLSAESPRVFLKLRRTLEYKNLQTCNRLCFYENTGTVEKRRFSRWNNALGFFCWRRSFKVHRQIKGQLFLELALLLFQGWPLSSPFAMCLSNLLYTFSFSISRCSFLKQSVVKKKIVSKRKESICKDMHARFQIRSKVSIK
jgi:hypothetical protein